MNDDDLSKYAYLWDPANGWSLSAHFHEEARLKILFSGSPTLNELKNARAILPLIPNPTLKEFFARYSKASEIDAGNFAARQARYIQERCDRAGLKTSMENTSYTSYSVVQKRDDSSGTVLLIDDNELAQRICKRMLAEGVPISTWTEG